MNCITPCPRRDDRGAGRRQAIRSDVNGWLEGNAVHCKKGRNFAAESPNVAKGRLYDRHMANSPQRPVRVSPGVHLRAEIERRKLTQAEVSDAVDVSRQSINNVINGRQPISRKMARKLAGLMGQAPDYWLRDNYPATRRVIEPTKKLGNAISGIEKKPQQRPPAQGKKVRSFSAFVCHLSDPVVFGGRLVATIKVDRLFDDINSWKALRSHLTRLGSSDEEIVSARALWKEYERSIRPFSV